MRFIGSILVALLAFSVAPAAWAWDGPASWYDDAAGKNPGGGGIIGTGGATDYNITCAHCHLEAESKIDVKFDFNPPLDSVGGQAVYAPGTTYQVAVTLVGEYLGTANCGQYMAHTNNFAATFENASGKLAGTLVSDAGTSSANCPQTMPDPKVGTTLLYNDCHAVIANGEQDRTSWAFSWTAPAAGSGQVTMFYGAVDGNCDMMSMGDDVKMGNMKIGEAMAALGPGHRLPGRDGVRRFAWLALLPLGLGAILHRRRKARPGH